MREINTEKKISYLYNVKDFCEEDTRITINGKVSYTNEIDGNYLYEKAIKINDLRNKNNNKKSELSNKNYELNSIINNINSKKSMIEIKRRSIEDKNKAIIKLNNLTNVLIEKEKDINAEVEGMVQDSRKQIEKVENNINKNEDFIKEIKKFEAEKENEIEFMRNNNEELKQKNQQLILMLKALESKIDYKNNLFS